MKRDDYQIIGKCTGANTVDDPARIGPNELAAAKDVVISEAGRISRGPGRNLLLAGDFHSGIANGANSYVCSGGSLYLATIYAASVALQGIRDNMSGAKVDFAPHGERTYYMNGTELGYLIGNKSYVWGKDEWLGPKDSTIHFGDIPIGQHLWTHGGRMFIAVDDWIFWSRLGQFGLFNLAEDGWRFDSKVIMGQPTERGIFISTKTAIYFLSGFPGTFQEGKLTSYPALEWSNSRNSVPCSEVGLASDGECVFWLTTKGAMAGTPGGSAVNITRGKIVYPRGTTGAAIVSGYNLIQTIR